jgi:2-keto-4-pentenoate hydratase
MADDRISAAAALFAQAWRDGTIIDAFPSELAPRDLAEAMAMQDAMAAQIGEDIVGWKIGGRPGAPAGRIFASTSFDNGATLPLPRFAPNIMEFEIGFKLKSDLPPREQPYEREEVAAAADLAINVELVGSRRVGVIERAAAALAAGMPFPDNEAEGFVITADNAGNLGLVNGPVIEDWQHRSLLDITVDLRIDGGESQPLLPKQARTEPFDVLLWAANDLSRRGIGLKAGHIITPGSVNVPLPLPAGSTAVGVFEDLGQITVSLAAA